MQVGFSKQILDLILYSFLGGMVVSHNDLSFVPLIMLLPRYQDTKSCVTLNDWYCFIVQPAIYFVELMLSNQGTNHRYPIILIIILNDILSVFLHRMVQIKM